MINVKVIEDATGPVLPLAVLRQQCEVVAIDGDIDSDGEGGTHPDDALLLRYLNSAVDAAEDFTGLSLQLRTYEAAFDTYPLGSLPIEIPKPPLVELISFVSSQDSDGAIDPGLYLVDDFAVPAQLRPYSPWPFLTPSPNTMRIRYRAGYSSEDSDAQPLPKAIEQALLLTVAEWYKNRENTVEGAVQELPASAENLLRPKRVRKGMA
jgi:uncharacterized phiE125 gp8 family phage protein